MSNSIDAADRMPSSEIERILADSKKAHDALAQLHRELEEQISVLDRQAFSRGRKQSKPPIYEPGETAQRKRLRDSQSELSDSITVLAAVTAARLSDSNEVAGLRDRMQTINAALQDDLARLRKIEKFAATAAEVSATVDKAVAEISKHVTKLT